MCSSDLERILRGIIGGVVRVVPEAVVLLAVEDAGGAEVAVVREEALLVVVREIDTDRELGEQAWRRLIGRSRGQPPPVAARHACATEQAT